MGFLFKKKISIDECVGSIVYFISKMQHLIHDTFDEVLYINHIGENKIDEFEKIRRDWELLFYIVALILIWIDNNLNEKDKLRVRSNLIRRLAEICSDEDSKELIDIVEFAETIDNRVNAYRYPGPEDNLAKCFLSLIYYGIPDPNHPYIFLAGMPELTYVMLISLKIIEYIDEFFKRYKIL